MIVSLTLGAALLLFTLFWEAVLEGRLARRFGNKFRHNPSPDRTERTAVTANTEPLPETSTSFPGRDRDQRNNVFTPTPLIPLSLFASYDVCATELAAFTAGMVMIVLFYFVAIFMVIVMGLTAASAGVQLIYFAPGMGAGTIIAITLIKKLRQVRSQTMFYATRSCKPCPPFPLLTAEISHCPGHAVCTRRSWTALHGCSRK